MINTDGLLAAVRVCKQPATGQGIFLGLIFLSFVSLLLSRGTDMQPSAWPAGWMPAQVPSPRWKSHLQPSLHTHTIPKSQEDRDFPIADRCFARREQPWLTPAPCTVPRHTWARGPTVAMGLLLPAPLRSVGAGCSPWQEEGAGCFGRLARPGRSRTGCRSTPKSKGEFN